MKSSRALLLSILTGLCVVQSGSTAETAPSDSVSANASKPVTAGAPELKWQQWSGDIFDRARREHKFVLLDLEAIWCHWCHVMDEKTYSVPAVKRLLSAKFIPIKVDQDSRPDLSNRYEEYGWPATVVFTPSGKEAEIRSGYIPADEMISMLNDVVKHPDVQKVKISPPSGFSKAGVLSTSLRKELQFKHVRGYDTKDGGWSFSQKFLDWDSVEYAMQKAIDGDKGSAKRAKETLNQQQNLIDPVWGGVYQYSTNGDWKHPHFEKIMQMQAENLRVYALGYMLFHDPAYVSAAKNIHRYLQTFLLSPEGAFYTSQDADLVKGKHSAEYFALDDAGRRKLGIPAIDKHIYARENGWAIVALTDLYMATGDKQYLKQALAAADWIIQNRWLSGGGFRHDAQDNAGPFLGDSLAMGRACLYLYTATADRSWLTRAQAAADFISKHFSYSAAPGLKAGFATAAAASGVQPLPLLDENTVTARFGNLLFHYSGRATDKALAQQAMRYLASPQIARKRQILVAGILLADLEISKDPAHLVVVGAKDDTAAGALFIECLKYPCDYKRIEWLDRKEGVLPHSDVEYPKLPQPAAFVCAGDTCSAPLFDSAAVAKRMKNLIKL